MDNKEFDISHKRMLLYKRNKRRKMLLNSFLLISFSSFIYLLIFLNNKYTSSTPTINKAVATAPIEEPIIITIDPGHGDWDSGTKGVNGSLEKDVALAISLKLGNILESDGLKVVYTRTNDSMPWVKNANDSLKERLKVSEAFKSDLFISIHCNSDYSSSESEFTKGIETWYNPIDENGKKLANSIQRSLVRLNYTKDRGLKTSGSPEDSFAVLKSNYAIPVLVELGFLSNEFDERYLTSENGQKECAQGLYEGITTYIKHNKDLIKNR